MNASLIILCLEPNFFLVISLEPNLWLRLLVDK